MSVLDSEATVSLSDGSERVIAIPSMIHVTVGMSVTIFDRGDGKPAYKWG